jgi:putative acetyltransferase
MLLRPFSPADTTGIIALIDGVYREHGDEICLADADSDLLEIPARYLAPGGAFVVLDDQGAIRGSHAVLPFTDRPGVCTFRRLYMDPAIRGSGWGETLMRWAFDWAQAHAFSRVEFWSDTRFTRAHRFFRRLGFVHDGQVREMHDGAMPYREFFFYREIPTLEK